MAERKWIRCDGCGKKIWNPSNEKKHELKRKYFANKFLLGRDDVLCWWCFMEWYDGGVTNLKEMRHKSRISRLKWKYENEQAQTHNHS